MSRRRQRGTLDPFGLSFLDLVSCAFAGVLILYLTADAQEAEEEQPSASQLHVVEAQAADGAPVVLGLRVTTAGEVWESWTSSTNPSVQWVRSRGRLVWLRRGEVASPRIDVVALQVPADRLGQSIDVRVSFDSRSETVLTLDPTTLYRQSWSPP